MGRGRRYVHVHMYLNLSALPTPQSPGSPEPGIGFSGALRVCKDRALTIPISPPPSYIDSSPSLPQRDFPSLISQAHALRRLGSCAFFPFAVGPLRAVIGVWVYVCACWVIGDNWVEGGFGGM